MANYAAANLPKALLAIENDSEMRGANINTYLAFNKNAGSLFPTLAQLRTNETRPNTDIFYNTRVVRTPANGRSHTVSGTVGDVATLAPSWISKSDKFTTSMKMADNNLLSLEKMFSDGLKNCLLNLAEYFESYSVDFLFAGRSQVNAAATSSEGTFNGTHYVFEITESGVGDTRPMVITDTVMQINKYGGKKFDIFCDNIAYNKFAVMTNQGPGNSINKSFQFENLNFIRSFGLTAKAATLAPYTKGFWMVAPQGSYGCIPWIPKQNRMGVQKGYWVYSAFNSPIDANTYAMYTYPTAVDGTSINGYTQDIQDQFEISLDLSFGKVDLSVANEEVFQAFALV